MGWTSAHRLGGASVAQQGSNLNWVATAVTDAARECTALVVCNDGQPRLIKRTRALALRLLSET